jgi:hypothetical protein
MRRSSMSARTRRRRRAHRACRPRCRHPRCTTHRRNPEPGPGGGSTR